MSALAKDTGISNKVKNISLLGSVLVAFIHLREYVVNGDVGNILWTVFPAPILQTAVPFFFVAAGYWLVGHAEENGWWVKAVKSRARSLVVPFIILNFAAFVIAGDYTFKSFATAIGFVRGEYPALPQLWFVFRLFGFVLFSPVLFYIVRQSKVVAYSAALVIYGCVCLRACYVEGLRDSIGLVALFKCIVPPVGLAEIMLGMAFRLYGIPETRKVVGWCVVMAGFGVLFVRQFLPPYLAIPLFYVGIPIYLWGLWNVMSAKQFMPYFSDCTFGIYLFHYTFLRIFYYGLSWLGVINYAHNILSEIVIVLISVVGSAALTNLIKRNGLLRVMFLGGR